MDPQVLLIGAVVFVVSAVLIYLISAFTMREKTFEEVIAEQKKRNEEERLKEKQKKELKKKPKKAKEKPKEKTAQIQASEPEAKPHKMVNLEIDPEIIEPLDEPLEAKPKTKKKHAAKPILVNKEEEPVIADHPREFKHTGPPPKDDVEMKHEHDKMEKVKQQKHEATKAKKEGKHEKHHHQEAEQMPVVEEMVTQAVSKVQAAAPPVKEERKRLKMDDIQVSRNTDLIRTVQKASLAEAEVQTLIDILQNKQGPVQNWNMKSQKGDPVSQLRKQLEEKERALQEEQQMVMSASSKIKEMKQENAQEKLRYNSIEKNYKDKIEFQGQEIQALHSRIQQAHEQHMVEASQLRAHIQQLEAQKDQTRLQRLAEENKALRESLAKAQSEAANSPELTKMKDTVNILQKELSSNVMKLNAMENGKKTMEQKIAKLEEEKKKLGAAQQSSENVLEKRVDEVNQELRKSETKNKSLDKELQSAKKAFESAENECASLKSKLKELEQELTHGDSSTKEMEEKLKEANKVKSDMESNLKNMEKKFTEAETQRKETESTLKEANKVKIDMESNLKNMEKKYTEAEKQRKETENELKALQEEKSVLLSELKTTKEHQVKEAQEAPVKGAPNGDLQSETVEDTNKILRTEHEKLLSEKNSEINQLVSELESREESLTAKDSELKKLISEIDSWKSQVSEKDNEISQYKSQLNSREAETSGVGQQVSELKSEIDSSRSQISQLQKDLDLQKKKNNELREKNWKAMDALEKSEKSVSEKVKSAIKTEMEQLEASQSEDREILKRLFPTIVVKENPSHKEWMSQYGKEISAYISSLSSQPKEDRNSANYEAKVEQLESDNSRLLSQLREAEVSRDDVQSQLKQLEDNSSKIQSQVAQYRSVLGETENKLTQLENSVESEEKKWQERLQAKELELEQLKQDTSSLREQLLQSKGSSEDLSDLDFAYRCVEKSLTQIVDEMELKVQTLEGQLKASEERCTELQTTITQIKETTVILEREKTELVKSTADTSDLQKQLEELRRLLEAEQKKNKDLASNIVKLNGIIKTGHDALKQEQELVKKLQSQTANSSVPSESNTEVSTLKVKLEETEKQLEKEINANKLLQSKLAASQGSLNEAGTSV